MDAEWNRRVGKVRIRMNPLGQIIRCAIFFRVFLLGRFKRKGLAIKAKSNVGMVSPLLLLSNGPFGSMPLSCLAATESGKIKSVHRLRVFGASPLNDGLSIPFGVLFVSKCGTIHNFGPLGPGHATTGL